MITTSQQALIELLKKTLFNATPHIPDNTNWDEVFMEAKDHAVVGLAAPSVPIEVAQKWKEYVFQNTAHDMQVLYCQNQLVRLFSANGIPLVILKGTAASIYYPDPLQRTMGDIDFLVSNGQFEIARETMEKHGYNAKYGYDEDSIHMAFTKNGILLEMHRHFNISGLSIDKAIWEGFAHRCNASVIGCEFEMLPTLENGLVLLAHIRHHLIDEQHSLGLRQIIDWMMYVHANNGRDGWKDAFMALARQYRLDTLASIVTAVCKKQLGMPDDVDLIADEATTKELFELIMANGDFSVKRDYVELKNKQVQVAYQNLKLIGTIKYMQWAGMKHWKAAQRFRVLRPFAWLYQIIHFISNSLLRIMAGKPLIRELNEGKKRKEFLKRLGI